MNLSTGIRLEPEASPLLETAAVQDMVHELRQPLSTIESIAYYLGMVLPPHEERAREQAGRIRQLVEQSNWILSCGMRLAGEETPSPEALDLEEVLTQAVSARNAAGEAHPVLDLAGNLPLVQMDPTHARALIENLLILMSQHCSARYPLRIRTWKDGAIFMEFATAVPGHRSEASLGAGAALGVESARRIVEAHSGAFALHTDPESGIRVQVVLP